MNRRSFLSLIGAATTLTAGGIALIDVLAPSEKTFFLPPDGGWNHRGQVLWHGWDIKNWSPEPIQVETAPGAILVLHPGRGLTWHSPHDFKPRGEANMALLVRDNAYWSNPPYRQPGRMT